MAKPKQPRSFHNLDGLYRDVEASRRETNTEPGGSAFERWLELVDIALNELDAREDVAPAEDDADDASDGDQSDVAGALARGGEATTAALGGSLARSSGVRTPASLLDGLLDYVPGHLRAAAIAELDELRRDALGSPERRVTDKRLAAKVRP